MNVHISCHNPNFGTAGQIEPTDVAEIAKQGYKSIINNRPDGEEGPEQPSNCLLYTSPSPRDRTRSRMPSSA